MFSIKLVDIAGDGLVVEYSSKLETLAEVELLIVGTINEKLGLTCIQLEHTDDLVYSVWLNGHEIGIVVIKDVNPVPKGAKNESDTSR